MQEPIAAPLRVVYTCTSTTPPTPIYNSAQLHLQAPVRSSCYYLPQLWADVLAPAQPSSTCRSLLCDTCAVNDGSTVALDYSSHAQRLLLLSLANAAKPPTHSWLEDFLPFCTRTDSTAAASLCTLLHQLSLASESAASFLQHTCWQGLNLDPHMAQQLNAHGGWQRRLCSFAGAVALLSCVLKQSGS